MRTKTVLLTALLGAASIASSVAQTVYSVNAVGYVNVTIPAGGFALLANPLNQPDNTLSAVLPDVPTGTTAYVLNSAGSFVTYTKRSGTTWTGSGVADVKLNPGTGFFIKNPDNTNPLTVTFVGEVPQTTDSTTLSVPFKAGFNLIGSIVPQAGTLEGTLGYTASVNDVVYKYDSTKGGYTTATRRSGGNWTGTGATDGAVQISVAQGFWLNTTNSGNWTRSFTIGN